MGCGGRTEGTGGATGATKRKYGGRQHRHPESGHVSLQADQARAAGAVSCHVLPEHRTAAKQDASAVDLGASKGFSLAGFTGSTTTPYLVAAAAVGAATYEMVKQAGDFQKQVTRIYTTAGETAPLQTLDAGLLQIARDTGTTTSQLTAGLYIVSSAGYNAASGLDVLKAAAEGAKAENADLGTVTNALTTILKDYNLGTDKSVSTTNQMIAAVSAGKMNLQDFASSLSTVLPIANSVGLSFAQVAGAEATLTAAGVSADQATQDLHAVISTLIAPTAAQVTAMQQMGLSSVDLSKNLGSEGLTGTLQEMFTAIAQHMGPAGLVIQDAMKNATLAAQDLNTEIAHMPPQLQTLAQQLLNGQISFAAFRSEVRSLPEGLTNLGQQFEATYNQTSSFNAQLMAGVNASPTFTAELKAMTGQTNAMNAVLMLTGAHQTEFVNNVNNISAAAKKGGDNISGWSLVQKNLNQQLDELREEIQTIAISLGQKLLPPLTTFLGLVVDLLKPVTDLSEHTHELGKAFEAFAAGFFPLLLPFVLLNDVGITVGKTFSWVKSVFDDLMSPLDAAASDVTNAWGQVEQGAESVASFLDTIWNNPLQSAKKYGDDLVGTFNDTLSGISGWAIGVGQDIASGIGQGLRDAKQWSDDLTRGVEAGVRDVIRNAPQWGRDIGNAIIDGLMWLASYDISSLINWKKQAVAAYQGAFVLGRTMIGDVMAGWDEGFKNVKHWGVDIIHDVGGGILAGYQALFNMGRSILLSIGNGAVASYQMAFQWGREVIKNVGSGLVSAVGSIGHFFTSLPGLIDNELKSSGSAMADKQIEGIKSPFHDVGRMKNLGDDILKGVAIAIGAVAGAVVLLAASLGIAIINGILAGLRDGAKALAQAIQGLWSVLSVAFGTLTRDITQWASDVVDDVIKVFETLPDKIGKNLVSAGSSFVKDIGRDLHIPGFASGTGYAPGGLSLVGENGPELVNLPTGSQVLTAAETRAQLGAGSGGKVVINQLVINNNVDAALVVRQIGWQLANAA